MTSVKIQIQDVSVELTNSDETERGLSRLLAAALIALDIEEADYFSTLASTIKEVGMTTMRMESKEDFDSYMSSITSLVRLFIQEDPDANW